MKKCFFGSSQDMKNWLLGIKQAMKNCFLISTQATKIAFLVVYKSGKLISCFYKSHKKFPRSTREMKNGFFVLHTSGNNAFLVLHRPRIMPVPGSTQTMKSLPVFSYEKFGVALIVMNTFCFRFLCFSPIFFSMWMLSSFVAQFSYEGLTLVKTLLKVFAVLKTFLNL